MLRSLAFVSVAALGATMSLPAIALVEQEVVEPQLASALAGPPQRVTSPQYDVAPLGRDGYTVEMPKPIEPVVVSVTPITGLLSTWPCSAQVNDGFGPRGEGMHNGIDIMCSNGTPLVASAAGVVVEVELGGSWGQYIKIDHGGGIATLYSHLIEGSPTVAVGQVVAAGEGIGLVGASGNASVAHCHFEVWVDGTRVDPMPWLP
ncbi:murein DD-endopeptidase MepM/ murein hydrolase activator NlpD [Leifsonia sp. AK011]|uniref:M23 family metallopeptidase n=1 Tax=Leifsonia sp. AK011 TaxID=2723075 RepID=UPI0015CC9761|nr:M23 family metallopeptidase [Leifsonia sp. AK011]NYF11118.1 murein DD-endopeptidase MepM/ murein hydrolase activator NlpD [Leifsonia sp. AK011]